MMRFRPEQHLRRQSDIRAVRELGRRVDCRAFTLWWKRREPAFQPAATTIPPSPDSAVSPEAAAGLVTPATGSPATSSPRVCVIASTAAVGAAVQRNRAKRRLRELFRHHQALVPQGCDLLLIARAAVTKLPTAELGKKFADACLTISPVAKKA